MTVFNHVFKAEIELARTGVFGDQAEADDFGELSLSLLLWQTSKMFLSILTKEDL